MKIGASSVRKDLLALANPQKAKDLARFFKTGPGQYGEGDIFLGIMVSEQRKVAKKWRDLSLEEVVSLLHSKEHECRLTALLILVDKYESAVSTHDLDETSKIYKTYLANTKWINNWDMVDLSAPRIVGSFMADKSRKRFRKLLFVLACSPDLWERRIAVISTMAFIINGEYADTFRIARILLRDEHDLIHKAVGWMLREVGKRCGTSRANGRAILMEFLDKNRAEMPRTMLRYAIEHFSPTEKEKYMRRKWGSKK